MLKVIWVSLKVRSIYFNPDENSCLNACVLLRSESIEVTPDPFYSESIEATPNLIFAMFNFAKGLAKVKLGGVC